MNLRKHLLAILAIALAVSTLSLPSAAAVDPGPPDLSSETVLLERVIFGNECKVTAGTPVTVTVNGRRFLQAVGIVDCEYPVSWDRMSMTTNHGGWNYSHRGITSSNGRVTIVVRRPCDGWAKTWNYSQLQVTLTDMLSLDSVTVADRSGWTLRSCGR